jgi:hypothetical protein
MHRWPVPADHLPGQVSLHGTKCLELFTVDDGAHASLRFAAYYNLTNSLVASILMRCGFLIRQVGTGRLNLELSG